MKNYIQKFICKGFILMAGASMVLTGCKESFWNLIRKPCSSLVKCLLQKMVLGLYWLSAIVN